MYQVINFRFLDDIVMFLNEYSIKASNVIHLSYGDRTGGEWTLVYYSEKLSK